MHIIAYARNGTEFDVSGDLNVQGITATVPRKITAEARGAKRPPRIIEKPLWPNYIFLDVTVDQYAWLNSNLDRFRTLSGIFLQVPNAVVASMLRDLKRVEEHARQEITRINNQEVFSQYRPGDPLVVVSGSFKEWLEARAVTFRRMATNGMIEVDVEGMPARMKFDPVAVRPVGG